MLGQLLLLGLESRQPLLPPLLLLLGLLGLPLLGLEPPPLLLPPLLALAVLGLEPMPLWVPPLLPL